MPLCECGIPREIVGYILNQTLAGVTAFYSRSRSHKELLKPMAKGAAALEAKGVFDGE